MRPPLLPGLRIIAKRLTRDESQRAVNPAARVGIERIIIKKIQEIGHRRKALFAREHSGFGDADCGTLPHARRRVMREAIQQRRRPPAK